MQLVESFSLGTDLIRNLAIGLANAGIMSTILHAMTKISRVASLAPH